MLGRGSGRHALVALALLAGGCATVLGADFDVSLEEDASGGAGGAASSSTSSASASSASASSASASSASASSASAGGAGRAEPRCDDGAKNGPETGLDCGGECPPCPDGETCEENADCATGLCKEGICACGGPGEPCCQAGSACALPLGCDGKTCALVSGSVTCSGCKSPNQLCAEHGFSGASEARGYWFWQCGGPGECPSGWSELACADWCAGTDCTGAPLCGGYPVVEVEAAPDAPLCASDHGYDCTSYNPGYLVRLRCH